MAAREPWRASARTDPAAHDIFRHDARPGADALQVRARIVPGSPAGLFLLFQGGTAARRWRSYRCASAISARRGPASWTRSSSTMSAKPKGGSRFSTGCARTTMRRRCGATSMPTGWPASSATGCWCTNSDGSERDRRDAADRRLAGPVSMRRCAAARSARWRRDACLCCPRCRSALRPMRPRCCRPRSWAASARTSASIPRRGGSAMHH